MEKLTNKGNKKTKVLAFALVLAYCLVLTVVPAFADSTDQITTSVTQGLGKVYTMISAIVLPVALIALAICAAKMVGGSGRSGEDAKAAAIRIVIGLAIVYMAPIAVKTVAGWFAGNSTTINGVTFSGTSG